ncbi:JmjC domain-containing histone demethylation protein 1 [Mucor velutinosus]|uniref:JmjC domain-containing histone demethylation protein 1 n=1 Tax=Mucor velutinosus TaxID=708070 RepID=A0AAN7HZU8_9FUNG|nr:JmjC domain-containing histone demethylation protein 1 [Mucor velutinosus]
MTAATANNSTRASLDEEHSTSMKKRNLSLPKLSHLRTTNRSNNADVELPTPTTSTTMNYCSDNEETHRRKRHSMASIPSMKDVATTNTTAAPSVHSRNRRKSSSATSVINLLENDFIELIPIDQVNSSKEAITGSYLAEDPGNYVLIFDNMFSRNTSKSLTFSVTSDEPIDEGLDLDNDMCGWLLKKRRKRMQGWAKRWFELSSTGVLSYSVRNGDIKRGSLQIMLATISIAPKQRTIHIDSGTTTFHLKALSADDFDRWLNSIRKQRSDTLTESWQHGNGTMTHAADIQSAISLVPDSITTRDDAFERNHQVIVSALHNLDAEIRSLAFIAKELSQLPHDASSSESLISQLQQQQQSVAVPVLHSHSSSSSSKLMRFPFMRGSSSNSIPDDHTTQLTSVSSSHQASLDKLHACIEALIEQRDKLSTAYNDTYENYTNAAINSLEIPSRTGTGFLSHRAASYYSYSAHSDQFFDAEDVLLNEDNESTYGSIVIDSEDEEDHQGNTIDKTALALPNIKRRTKLPHPVAVRNISVLGILRKNIGKDLSTISMPISLNEPVNFLQRLCEELEYSELLDKAATLSSSMDRLMYVAVFAISGYAATQYRIGRKPFNPMMSETYECIRPDKGFRFIAEKVSHYPNVMACFAESKTFTYRQTNLGKTKFWGKSLELITEGQSHISIKGHQDEYTYSKPSSWLRNLITGTKYLEHIGEMKVQNHTTGEYAVITFKEAATGSTSFFSSNNNSAMYRNNVVAKFFDCRGSLIREVEGKWSDSLSEVVGPDQYAVIWRCKPPGIPDYTDYYGLTSFATELNEITSLEQGKLPITDTRCRPDQRLFEQGQVQEAEDEKVRIEQCQRERRKQFESIAKPWKPLWFELVRDEYAHTGESWQYKGGYWEARETGQWPREMLQLW